MKKLTNFILLLLLISCKKELTTDKANDLYIGNWQISQKIFFEPTENLISEQPVLHIDTLTRYFDVNHVLKPIHQTHKTFLNSKNLLFDLNVALEISALDIIDGQYVFIYKSELIDIGNLKNITISCHGEQLSSEKSIVDKDVSLLLRLCSDSTIDNNYFEIEKPIILTKNNSNILSEIWPDENFINLDLNKLTSLKAERDFKNIDLQYTYIKTDNGEKRSIKSNPDLTKINKICIGLKNPGNYTSFNINDGYEKSIRIWIY